jgi:uncharacterized protein
MVVGVIVWDLEVVGAQSLKDKRRVVKSLKDRLHARFKVSAAETAHQDVWQRAQVAAALVSGEHRHVVDVIDEMHRLVLSEPGARVINATRSFY